MVLAQLEIGAWSCCLGRKRSNDDFAQRCKQVCVDNSQLLLEFFLSFPLVSSIFGFRMSDRNKSSARAITLQFEIRSYAFTISRVLLLTPHGCLLAIKQPHVVLKMAHFNSMYGQRGYGAAFHVEQCHRYLPIYPAIPTQHWLPCHSSIQALARLITKVPG